MRGHFCSAKLCYLIIINFNSQNKVNIDLRCAVDFDQNKQQRLRKIFFASVFPVVYEFNFSVDVGSFRSFGCSAANKAIPKDKLLPWHAHSTLIVVKYRRCSVWTKQQRFYQQLPDLIHKENVLNIEYSKGTARAPKPNYLNISNSNDLTLVINTCISLNQMSVQNLSGKPIKHPLFEYLY